MPTYTKANLTGRSTAHQKPQEPTEPYVGHTLAMRLSPAWRGLPDISRRILGLLEIEHMQKRGHQNGRLICTYANYEQDGIRRSSVREAIEVAAALGFLEIVRRGFKGVPSLYRLTYVKAANDEPPMTNEWRDLKSDRHVSMEIKRVKKELAIERRAKQERRKAKSHLTGAELNVIRTQSPGQSLRLVASS